ncbi:hypothetical protein [Methanobrevibacter sp.]|uniref:hypothetical protein n=1 Tax=Methanobrevibacter sp. TaxID=66852 RepID=UPI00386AF008
MNYKKIVLVGFISAFVAILTSVMGVAGTIIGSVISSVLYNMLTEALEKPVGQATFSTDFEWEIAYVFPLVVIALIQFLLILALLSEWGMLPYTFLNVYLSLQQFTDNNLYKLLGLALIVMSVYPIVIKPEIVKKSNGTIIAFVGLVFLARGFVDVPNKITDIYDAVFVNFDFPIAVVALILLLLVICNILISARQSENEFKMIKRNIDKENADNAKDNKVNHSQKIDSKSDNHKSRNVIEKDYEVTFKNHIDQEPGINQSSGDIQFESNDLLDDYKK